MIHFMQDIQEEYLNYYYVWINTNKLSYKETKVIDMQEVNWTKKGMAFLKAKFTGKKYGSSF